MPAPRVQIHMATYRKIQPVPCIDLIGNVNIVQNRWPNFTICFNLLLF